MNVCAALWPLWHLLYRPTRQIPVNWHWCTVFATIICPALLLNIISLRFPICIKNKTYTASYHTSELDAAIGKTDGEHLCKLTHLCIIYSCGNVEYYNYKEITFIYVSKALVQTCPQPPQPQHQASCCCCCHCCCCSRCSCCLPLLFHLLLPLVFTFSSLVCSVLFICDWSLSWWLIYRSDVWERRTEMCCLLVGIKFSYVEARKSKSTTIHQSTLSTSTYVCKNLHNDSCKHWRFNHWK